MNKDIDELFEGDFNDKEKSAVAKSVMEFQDRISSYGKTEFVFAVIVCAVYFVMAFFMLINFSEIVDEEMDPKAVHWSARHLTGKAGVVQDVLGIILTPFAVYFPINAAISVEKENKHYREFKAMKIIVSAVTEDESIKGLYTVTTNYGDKPICFYTTDSAAKDYAENSIMIVVDFVAVKSNTFKKNYDYYTVSPEKRRIMALRKVSDKYLIIHI